MFRRYSIAVLLFTATVSGCRTCDNPYDYCGPVVDSSFDQVGLRAGSRMSSPGIAPEEIPAPPPPPTAPPASPDVAPSDDPPPLGEMDMTSAMRSRLRYAR
jgi:hypothetical protein